MLSVEGFATAAVPAGKRLVLALEDEAGVDQMYLCGGKGICATCVVEFVSGEPTAMTEIERDKLAEKGIEGQRLSCQITCDEDMSVRALERVVNSTNQNAPGPRPADEIVPPPVWIGP